MNTEDKSQRMRVRVTDSRNGNSTDGEIRVQFWSKKERTIRALKFGGMLWGAALISIIIPLLHFILVPGFLLAGPIVAYIVMGQTSVILDGKSTCPYCKEFLPIARTAYRFPVSELCSKCQSGLKIEVLESA